MSLVGWLPEYERRLTCTRCRTVTLLFEASMFPADRHETIAADKFICSTCLTARERTR